MMIEPEANCLPMLHPGGPLNSFYSRRKERKSMYDWFAHLPRTRNGSERFQSENNRGGGY